MYTIKLEGVDELRRRMAHIKGGFAKAIAQALEKAAIVVQMEAKRQVGLGGREHLKVVSGKLQGSITRHIEGGGLTAVIGTNLRYARIHEYGGVIRPKKPGGVLVFRVETQQNIGQYRSSRRKDTAMSNVIFAKKVTIPARPYLGPAMAIRRAEVERTFARHMRELLDGK